MREGLRVARDEHHRFLPRQADAHRPLRRARPEDQLETVVGIAPFAREEERLHLPDVGQGVAGRTAFIANCEGDAPSRRNAIMTYSSAVFFGPAAPVSVR